MLFVIWLQPQETRQAISYTHCLTFLFFGLMLRLLLGVYNIWLLIIPSTLEWWCQPKALGNVWVHFVRSLIPFLFSPHWWIFRYIFVIWFWVHCSRWNGCVCSFHSLDHHSRLFDSWHWNYFHCFDKTNMSPLIFYITDIVIQKMDSFHPWTDYM